MVEPANTYTISDTWLKNALQKYLDDVVSDRQISVRELMPGVLARNPWLACTHDNSHVVQDPVECARCNRLMC